MTTMTTTSTRRSTSGAWAGALAGSVLAAMVGPGCPAYDESADGGADSTGAIPGTFPGHTVRCCYSGTFDVLTSPAQYFFCLGGIPNCIDESEGTDAATLASFCDQKCTPSWDSGTVLAPAPQLYDENFDPIIAAVGYLDSCVALPEGSEIVSTIIEMNSCNPSDPTPFGTQADVAKLNGAIASLLGRLSDAGFSPMNGLGYDRFTKDVSSDQSTAIDESIVNLVEVSGLKPMVIHSEQEGGYWSNQNGWVFPETATLFFTKPESMPSIGVPDCVLVPLESALADDDRQPEWRAQRG